MHGVDEAGDAIEVKDPLSEQLISAMADVSTARKVLAIDQVFGELGRNETVIEAVEKALTSLNFEGTKVTLQKYCDS